MQAKELKLGYIIRLQAFLENPASLFDHQRKSITPKGTHVYHNTNPKSQYSRT